MRILVYFFVLFAIAVGCADGGVELSEDDAADFEEVDSTRNSTMEHFEPSPPIKFSHSVHSGENSIDCKYCHSSATKSRNAGVPTVNVCMNCHRKMNDDAPDKETRKLYDAAGYDWTTDSYDGSTKPIIWKKTIQGNYEGFSHKTHNIVGISCKGCHSPEESSDIDNWVCAKCHY